MASKQRHVLIYAKTPYSKTPYDQWLANSDIEAIVLTSTEFADSYRHMTYVFSFDDYDRNINVDRKAYEIAQKIPLVGVFARAEADIVRAATLRERFEIPGQSVASARAYRHKVEMKAYLKNSRLTLPTFRQIRSAMDIFDFVEQHGYPVVIKPVMESGSFGTNIIYGDAELQRYLAKPYPGETEIETFVDGEMFHVDGLIINGEIVFIVPSQYLNDCLSFRKNEHLGSCLLATENPAYGDLVDAAKTVIANLPSAKNMAFHAEFWRTKNGQTVFCEIASRTGGALVAPMIEYGYGVNLDQEWFLAECGLRKTIKIAMPSFRYGGSVVIPPQNGILQALPDAPPPSFIEASYYTGASGQRFFGGVKSGLFLAGYVVRGDSEVEVRQNMSSAAEWFAGNSRWSLNSEMVYS